MAKPLILRIVIADGEHVRFLQPDVDNVLRTDRLARFRVRASAVA